MVPVSRVRGWLSNGSGWGTGWVRSPGQHRQGRQGTRSPPSRPLLPPPLPTTHLVVGLTVHLAAGRGVALSTETRAEGQVSRTILPARAVLLARRGHARGSGLRGTGSPNRVTGRAAWDARAQRGHRHHVPAVPQSCPRQAELPPCPRPRPHAVPEPQEPRGTYPAGTQLVAVRPVARQHFELLSPGFQVQLHPHHWGSGEMG